MLIGAAIGEAVLRRRSRNIVVVAKHDGGLRMFTTLSICQGLATIFLIFCYRLNFGGLITACVGLALMMVGITLRWWSVIHLGRFFTVKLRVVSDQHVINTGPYRYLRHPSYAGGLILCLGNGIALGNALSLLIIFIPSILYILKRIATEESLLIDALGDPYKAYMQHTKRLLPGVY
jgi:protein-S-isoprenylcysteine O-methyltransferase Ste14